MALKTRPPTGRVPWPLILIEGAEKAGKSWACAELSASPRVGQTYWIDLGEGSADEYGAIPGARYLVVDHNGTFASIVAAVEEIKALAAKASADGDPPVVLVVDSMTAEWDLLKGVADQRARERLRRKGRAVAADQEPQISMDLWNDVNGRHRKLMTHLMTFPGIAVVTARGKDVAALDAGGRPIEGSKEYKVDGQKNLAYDATVWLRVSRDHPPLVVGARSVRAGIRPGVDKPRTLPDLTLERVVFDVLGCDPQSATVRDVRQPQVTAADLEEQPVSGAPVGPERMRDPQRNKLFALLAEAGMAKDRDAALHFINEIIAPNAVESTKELTVAQASNVIDRLGKYVGQQTPSIDTRSPARKALEEHADELFGAPPSPAHHELQLDPPPVLDERRARRISQLLGRAGYTTDDAQLTYLSSAVARAVTAIDQITVDECTALLPVLETEAKAMLQGAGR